MFYTCTTRFDVTENLDNLLVFRLNVSSTMIAGV